MSKLMCLLKHKWVKVLTDRKGFIHYQCYRCFSFKTKRRSWFLRSGIILEPKGLNAQ